ncbi:bromodomain-containing protein [Hirsutella rhossiliensis]|uniref:Bromodomain-containing protein n=1 Tax=Hirsutella rhossiliensis TaxID=111463 RepID=A0A9P8SKC4_9HYPO|nr:bromodomain-containing protein [Hirsutella rhossiliensis]KAH0965776.1 bromodomain-containing protein [Hirsutella rhossiliensis]
MSTMAAHAPANGIADAPTPAAPTTTVAEKPSFSWLQPHPIFVIILVGPDEQPFGLQKDFLCHRSDHYRSHFAEKGADDTIENMVRLPDFTADVFGLAQNFLYTGVLLVDEARVPSYESLVSLWNLGHKLGIGGLCDKTLEAMTDCRRLTERIPATPLLIQVWRDTPEGSSIRLLLLSWAAEYMRSSDARAEFAKSLPQEVLSELVVTMSSFDMSPVAHPPAESPSIAPASTLPPRKNVHYLDDASDDDALNNIKKSRRPSGTPGVAVGSQDPTLGRKPSRTPLPKPQKRRSSAAYLESRNFTTAQKMEFCADLLNRMLSGPGFWTRLVGPFKEPVDPVEDGVPDYLDKVKRPMDLNTIKAKMDRRDYTHEDEFVADMRQIFDNCFTYWAKGDPMWAAGEKLQRTFEDKYSHMNKWIAKMGGDEGE